MKTNYNVELEKKLKIFVENGLSEHLFSDKNANRECKVDIHSFGDDSDMGGSYTYFLDNIRSLDELIQGLEELSPFADDALEIARSMTMQDFYDFKLALPFERNGKDWQMPDRFSSLVLPTRILKGMFLSQKAGAPLGTTLVRMLEVELDV